MDPNRQPDQRARPQAPSVDGFLPPGNRPAQPQPPRPAPPSASKRPFMPADFYVPPPPPRLPEIEDTPPPRREQAPRRQGMRDALSVFGVLASALLLAFCLINFVFQSYQVEGPSMRATLENSDHLIVWKVDRTIANLTGGDYIPNRGDIIIFNEPSGAEPNGPAGKQLIKRVVALPGERITIKGTEMTVFNQENPDGFNPDKTLPYGENIIFEKPSNIDVTVGQGEVFVVGDNRDNSLDSRVFGPLDAENIVGKLVVRILPLNTFKVF